MSVAAVRPATPADAEAIAGVSVRGWRHAYADLLDPQVLAERDVAAQTPRWRDLLAQAGRETWVAETAGRVVAYASIVPSADPDATQEVGTLDGLYVDPPAQGAGVGTQMHAVAVDALRGRGFSVATLWVFTGNEQGRAFYERAGWTLDPAGPGNEGCGWHAPALRYRRSLGAV